MNQEFHERLPNNLGGGTVRKEHVHETVEREKDSNFSYDKSSFDARLASEARDTYELC